MKGADCRLMKLYMNTHTHTEVEKMLGNIMEHYSTKNIMEHPTSAPEEDHQRSHNGIPQPQASETGERIESAWRRAMACDLA